MKAFVRSGRRADAIFTAHLEPEEAGMLRALAEQISELIDDRNSPTPNPALLRLLPDAYPDDAEASAEFRRFTVDELATRKVRNARVLAASVEVAARAAKTSPVVLDMQAAQAWIRALTDIRLAIATQLGITADGDEPSERPDLIDLYDWLAFVQSSLIDELTKDL